MVCPVEGVITGMLMIGVAGIGSITKIGGVPTITGFGVDGGGGLVNKGKMERSMGSMGIIGVSMGGIGGTGAVVLMVMFVP